MAPLKEYIKTILILGSQGEHLFDILWP